MLKVDLHVHTQERSACATSSEVEQIRAAITAGLDAIFITDHHRFVPVAKLESLNRAFTPFRIFGGIEVSSQGEDFIILGWHDTRMEESGWSYACIHSWVREHGGFIALAHPFRFWDGINVDLERFPPDAIEIHSPNTPVAAEARIRDIAARLKIPVLCDSDAHTMQRLGQYYNILEQPVFGEQELLSMLKAGRFTCQNNGRADGNQNPAKTSITPPAVEIDH